MLVVILLIEIIKNNLVVNKTGNKIGINFAIQAGKICFFSTKESGKINKNNLTIKIRIHDQVSVPGIINQAVKHTTKRAVEVGISETTIINKTTINMEKTTSNIENTSHVLGWVMKNCKNIRRISSFKFYLRIKLKIL